MSKGAMFEIVKNDLVELEREMMAVVHSPVELVTEIGIHLIEAGGKRLRPALYFLATRCAGDVSKSAIPLAVSVEMIHMATLVHDDVIDNADTRRGVSTANAKWGNQLSVLSGDYLFAKAFSLVAQSHYTPQVISILSDIICDLSEGEIMQNQETFNVNEDEAGYYDRIAKKTANFIAASCQLGGFIADLAENEVRALWEYGYSVGMAFQITDDILDLTATSEQIGKPTGNDILQGIVTLPVIRALHVSPNADELRAIAGTRDMDRAMLERAVYIVQATDAVEYSYEKVKEYLDRARVALPLGIPKEIREAYIEIADFVAMRDF